MLQCPPVRPAPDRWNVNENKRRPFAYRTTDANTLIMVVTDARLLLILASKVAGAMTLFSTATAAAAAAAAVAVGSSASAASVDMISPIHRTRATCDQLMFVSCTISSTIDTAAHSPARGLMSLRSSCSCPHSRRRRSDSRQTMDDATASKPRRRRSDRSPVLRMGHQRQEEAASASDSEAVTAMRPLTRGRMLERTAATSLELGFAFGGGGGWRTRAASAEELEEYVSPDGSFALRYPSSFKGFSKPLKTHKVEVNFKNEEVKGFEVGVAIDPVRIESLESFGTPEEVGARVMRVEQGKDGTLDTKLLETKAEKQGDLSLYTLDYFVESTRGFKHFVAKVTIKDNLLYACTAQAKEKDYPEVEKDLKRIVDSFRVPA